MIKTTITIATLSIVLIGGGAVTVHKVNDLSKEAKTHVTRDELATHLRYNERYMANIVYELRRLRGVPPNDAAVTNND